MTLDILSRFFMWCTLLNAGMLLLMAVATGFAGDLVYRTHSRWFPMPRDAFNAALYVLVGIYKILVLLFNLVPWLALLIIR